MLTHLIPLLLAAAPDPAALRAQAQAAYDAKQYAKACPLFEKVTRLLPEDGAAWSDLSLCLFRTKKREQGVRAAFQALHFGDEQTRKSTYFNLGKFTSGEASFTSDDSSCQVARMPGCGQTLWLCHDPYSGLFKTSGANGSGGSFSNVHVCTRPSSSDEGFASCTEIELGGSSDTFLEDSENRAGLFESRSCTLVAVDPCAKRLGLTCEESAGTILVPADAVEEQRKPTRQRAWVEERTFTLPQAPADGGT